jgi:hypothetical protein
MRLIVMALALALAASGQTIIRRIPSDEAAKHLVKKASATYPTMDTLAIELKSTPRGLWAGYGPATETRNMFDWLKKNF